MTSHPERRIPRNGLLEPGRNCWRVERARRLAFLRDGEAYFHAACEAMAQARRSILLLAWDVDSELRINRHGVEGLPERLADFLDALARRRRGLHVHILAWDFASIFALEREKLPTVKLDWATHRRVHLFLDDRHPVGASHHQKVLVVDDEVAFVGGLDLTRQRWDTPAHDPADPERRDHSRPEGYPPFHDVQAVVEGDAARALGTLARERWRLVTGEQLPRSAAMRDCWPAGVAASLVDVDVGIARTIPAMDEQEEVREVERLYVDEIASARRALYIENQYFTSQVVADALENSLLERDGPEIVIVLPCTSSGWLEEATMGQLRSRWILRLRAADHAHRLRIVYPGGPARADVRVNVHAKVLVRDEDHVRVGSSNTSNRSMGFDTECDLAVDAANRRTREGIAHFRAELIGEHLGMTPRAVDAMLRENGGSLVRLVDATAGGERAFEPLEAAEPSWLGAIEPAIELADPSRRPRQGPPPATSGRGLARRLVLTGLGVIALTLLWTMTPLRDWLRPDVLAGAASGVRSHPVAMAGIVLAHAAAGLLAVPVTLLILATILAFGPGWGSVLALLGCLANAAAGYGAGRLAGRGIERILRDRFAAVVGALRRHGALSIAALRFVPVAPYTFINYAAGALRVPFRDYMAGTTLGILPGIVLFAALGKGVRDLVTDPSLKAVLLLAAIVAAWIAVALLVRRRSRAGRIARERATRMSS